jgi:putative thymidine phosphorylase
MTTLKVKDMDIATGSTLVAIINMHDAKKLDLFALDRIRLKKGRKEVVVIVDIGESIKAVPEGQIGLFEEVLDELGCRNGAIVQIFHEEKPKSVEYIKNKLDGKQLTKEQINDIVHDIVNNKLGAIEITFFVSGCYTKGLTTNETIYLIDAIVNNGDQLKLDKEIVMDKHCSGGVPGNRTTMIIVPIIAAAGITIPKTSSRSISSPAGTADTVEVLTKVTLPIPKMKEVIKKTNACLVWGGSMSLAAADDKMIKVRHPLSLDPEGLLLASILSKKKAVNATHILIDLPVGPDIKISSKSHANRLGKRFMEIGERIGMKIRVMISDGSQPIGNGIGPLLEARDVLYALKGDKRAPLDLKEKSVYMAGLMLEMAGEKNGQVKARQIIDTGKAYKKFVQIIEAQGGKAVDPDKLEPGKYRCDVIAEKAGRIGHIDNFVISKIAQVAGAPLDKKSGIYLYKHMYDNVEEHETLYTIYAESQDKLDEAREIAIKVNGFVIE